MNARGLAAALVCFVAACLAPGLPALAASGEAGAADLAGRWEGRIGTGDEAVAFFVDLARTEDGGWVGEIDIPFQGVEDFPLSVRPIENGVAWDLAVEMPDPPHFEATRTDAPDRLEGVLLQGDLRHAISLSRTGDAEIASLDDVGRPLDVLVLDDDAAQLREAFNAATESARLIVLLSPT